jgi:N-acetylglutamate synthase-like GNAT family acetyltransferase
MSVTISKASVADLDDLLALLTAVNLPHEGVSEHINNFLVARNADGRLIGCIGLERYDRLALLRSVAVSADSQQTGIGLKLTAELLTNAARAGIKEVVLLTTTARDFFSRHFGFVEANREDYNERLATSPEWLLPRCSSAAFMRLQLKQKAHSMSDEQN